MTTSDSTGGYTLKRKDGRYWHIVGMQGLSTTGEAGLRRNRSVEKEATTLMSSVRSPYVPCDRKQRCGGKWNYKWNQESCRVQ